MVTDSHGNVGYDTAEECDAAVKAGTAKFYQPFIKKPSALRAGEVRVQVMSLKEIAIPDDTVKSMSYQANDYKRGACDIGVGAKWGQDGVTQTLIGKYVPYSPDMPINAYLSKRGVPVRVAMKQCNNRFAADLPRPVPSNAPVAVEPAQTPVANVPPTPPATPVVEAPVPATPQAAIGSAMGLLGFAGLKPPRKPDPAGSREFQPTEFLREENQIQ